MVTEARSRVDHVGEDGHAASHRRSVRSTGDDCSQLKRLKPTRLASRSKKSLRKSHNHSPRRRNHAKRSFQFLPLICAATGENWVAKRGATDMRHEQQPIAAALNAVDFKFRFQMTHAGTRHDCSVTIQAVTIFDATAVFRVNWPTIENLARRSLAANDLSDIRLQAALAD
jgi:hypothetical protein